jgi:cell division protein FtsB
MIVDKKLWGLVITIMVILGGVVVWGAERIATDVWENSEINVQQAEQIKTLKDQRKEMSDFLKEMKKENDDAHKEIIKKLETRR